MKLGITFVFCLSATLLVAACGVDKKYDKCDPLAPDCDSGMVCELVQGGEGRCFEPLVIQGTVLDASDDSPVSGALVQATDENGAPVGTSTETNASGDFALTVPATRDSDGNPVSGTYMLRVQAMGYQPFPTAIRPALPLEASAAQGNQEDGWVIENALTTVKLLPLPGGTSGLGSISGSIQAGVVGGILLVAENTDGGHSGYSDGDGDYTIFNVPAGSYTVHGYLAGLQLTPADATLAAGEHLTGVDLAESGNPLSTVSGHVQKVNAPPGLTSIVLAVESTYVENAARGEVPPGLRVGEVDTDFTLTDVPDGRYVVLAAFENDLMVQDPDQTIGGTNIVHVEAPDPASGNDITLEEGFKITGALDMVYPGAEGPEGIPDGSPTFQFASDTSEEGYELYVFDAFGNQVWTTEIGPVNEATVEHPYDGPALEEDMYYQFRALSYRTKTGERTAISATEDLKGVFFLAETP
jgi:hypothetical protein